MKFQAIVLGFCLALPTSVFASEPSTTAVRQALDAVPRDPHAVINQSHYVVSNEFHHHTLRSHVKPTGGVYIGIGTDQNFILIPWAKPRYAVMLDLDQVIVNVHRVYEVAFRVSKTPSDFRLFFAPGRQARSRRAIQATVKDPALRRVVKNTLRRYRASIYKRLNRVRGILRRSGVKAYLTDQDTYDFLATMCREGRFYAIRGDLTGTKSMRGMAAVFRRFGLQVGTIFFSNAERYFKYTGAFKTNMRSLPFGPQAEVIRTSKNPNPRTYQYYFQAASGFLAWLSRPKVRRVKQIVKAGTRTKTRRVYRVEKSPGS